MGIFRRNTDLAATPVQPDQTLGSRDVIPAGSSITDRISAGGNAAIGKATQFYKQNPKLVGGLALLGSALLLNRMRSRGLR